MSSNRPDSSDIHPGPGFRIRVDIPRHDAGLIDGLAAFDTPTISDLLNRLYAVDSAIHCLTRANRLHGSVCTVNTYPGDNLMVHKSLDIAKPGDVVVINAHAGSSNAVLGDILATKAMHRGIEGFIVDGLIRDLPDVLKVGLPVFARGTTPVGPLHRGPGEINYPIACGGVVAHPGDIVIADAAGIVVVPHDSAPDLLTRLESGRQRAAEYLERVQRGEFSNAWVDDLLLGGGCVLDEDTEDRGTRK